MKNKKKGTFINTYHIDNVGHNLRCFLQRTRTYSFLSQLFYAQELNIKPMNEFLVDLMNISRCEDLRQISES